MTDPCNDRRKDLASGISAFFVWCIPAAILIVSAMAHWYQGLIWPIVLAWMGGACLWNARHCGRRHCYFTGPFFLALAAASALYGLGILQLGSDGWQTLSTILLVGAFVFTCLPEWLWGKYIHSQPSAEDRP